MHESGCRLLTLALSRLRVTSFEVGRQIQRDSKGRQLAQLSLAGASQRYLAQLLKAGTSLTPLEVSGSTT